LSQADVPGAWIEKPLENQPIFMKTEEIGRDRFHRFFKNWPGKFEIFKKLK
jgi:hypothetical protein